MKKRFFTLILGIASVIGNTGVWAQNSGNIITLDLSQPLNPATFDIDSEKGHWSETYNDEDYPFIEFNTFAFSHIPGMMGGGYYWDGFTYCTSGDITNYGEEGSSVNWISNQWGCIAGGGIKTDAGGNIVKDANGDVEVEAGIPYLVAYWGYFMEAGGDHCLQTIITENGTFEAVGIYISNHPWPYYGNLYGDGFASPFEQEGDFFKLIIHGLDEEYNETGKYVEHTLAEYKDGELIQSNKWEWVDLSSLGRVGGFYFTLESSDTDPLYGPNTAVYFCLDKLQVRSISNITDIQTVTSTTELSVYPNPFTDHIVVDVPQSSFVEVYTIHGEKVLSSAVSSGTSRIDMSHLPKGAYILHCNGATKKIIK